MSNNLTSPKIIKGNKHSDERGSLSFINDFDLKDVRRSYIIEPANTEIIRAWQGHKTEWKYFQVIQGSFTIGLVKIDNWDSPSKQLKPEFHTLNANTPSILIVPGGYANGITSNEPNAKLLVFSSSTLENAKDDEFRFPDTYWDFKM